MSQTGLPIVKGFNPFSTAVPTYMGVQNVRNEILPYRILLGVG